MNSSSYADLVVSYAGGDAARAIRALEGWKDSDVRTAVERTIGGRDAPANAAVMLHTDIAAGAEVNTSQSVFHLGLARRLVGAARARIGDSASGSASFVCGWYVLATSILLARGDSTLAGEYVTEGVEACPLDRRVRLWQGIAADNGGVDPTMADSLANSLGNTRRRGQPLGTPASPMGLSRYGANAAITAYRQALKIDAAYMDAHLRLAELLDRMTSHDEAIRELADVIAQSHEPPLLYLAHLFTGRVRERTGDLAGAAADYEAALAAGRGCQTAYTALSFVEDRLGNPAKAREVAAQFAALPDTQKFVDPWWSFKSGGGVERDLLDTLRKAARR